MKCGYCSVCGRYVWLLDDGACENGHGRAAVSRVRELDSWDDLAVINQPHGVARLRRRAAGRPDDETAASAAAERREKRAPGRPRTPLVPRSQFVLILSMIAAGGTVAALFANRTETVTPVASYFSPGGPVDLVRYAPSLADTLSRTTGVLLLWAAVFLAPRLVSFEPPAEGRRANTFSGMAQAILLLPPVMTTFVLGGTGGAHVAPLYAVELALIWGVIAVFVALTQPWKRGDPLASPGGSPQDRARRTRVVLSLAGLAFAVSGGWWWSARVTARSLTPPEWLVIVSLPIFAAGISALQLMWDGPRLGLDRFRARLRASRAIMFVVSAIGSAYLVVLSVLYVTMRAAPRTFGRMIAENQWACLLPWAVLAVVMAVFVASKLVPVGGLRWLGGRRLPREALLTALGAMRPVGAEVPLVSSAVDGALVRLGREHRPDVFLIQQNVTDGAFVLLGPHAEEDTLVLTRRLLTLKTEKLTAIVVWLLLRRELGYSDWWNERAVTSYIDQETMHLLEAPEAMVGALAHFTQAGSPSTRALHDAVKARFPQGRPPRGLRSSLRGLAPLVSDGEDARRRVATLKGSILSGEWVVDPLDWDRSIPLDVQKLFDGTLSQSSARRRRPG